MRLDRFQHRLVIVSWFVNDPWHWKSKVIFLLRIQHDPISNIGKLFPYRHKS